MFPKIHKPENPGRRVISSVNCLTTSRSQYVDHQLQPHVKEFKSYVKDSTDFIKKKRNLGEISQNSILGHNVSLFTVYQHSTQRRHKNTVET